MGRDLSERFVIRPPELGRRQFLGLAVGALAACRSRHGSDTADTATPDRSGTCGPGAPSVAGDPSGVADPGLATDPFTLGVASGDPMSDRVILWTRLAVDPLDATAMGEADVELIWEISSDPDLAEILQTGVATAAASLAHSVHVDVDGLDPDTVYWYRFRIGDWRSPIGRTRTLPCADASPTSIRLGFATCQRYTDGYYAAHRDLAEQEVDLVVFLGDYIYESGSTGIRDMVDGAEA